MDRQGAIWTTTILTDKAEIIQVNESLFELFIRDTKFGVFPTATAAWNKIKEVVVELGEENPSIVPHLNSWEKKSNAPFDPDFEAQA